MEGAKDCVRADRVAEKTGNPGKEGKIPPDDVRDGWNAEADEKTGAYGEKPQ